MLNSFIKKLILKIIDIVAPPGAIMMYGGSQVPEGWILIQNVKVYEDELPRLYPVLAACPELEKGQDEDERKWVKMVNPDGRVPQFTTSGSLVWKLLEAQLPNITGKAGWPYMGMSYTQNRCQFDGALYDTTEELNDNASFNSNADTNKPHLIGIDASRGNSAYSGTKLQVPALQTLVCIKF